MAVARERKGCIHWWKLPSPGEAHTLSYCKRCGATRRFLQHLPHRWSSMRLARRQLQEMNEDMRAAERQAQ